MTRSMMLTMWFVVAAALFGTQTVSGQASDPRIGSWKLNVAKSTFTHGPAMKCGARTYEESRDGMISVTLKSVGADGKETTLMRSFKQDGKDYPINDSSGVDSISETRVNANTAKYAEKKAGKVVLSGRRVLSKHGRMLTVTETGADETGNRIEETLVYERE